MQDEGEGGITQLRKKYFRLVKVALNVQNYLEDFADTLERLHAFINWADPKATLVFIFACLAAVLAIAAFSLPVVLSIGLCWTVLLPSDSTRLLQPKSLQLAAVRLSLECSQLEIKYFAIASSSSCGQLAAGSLHAS